MNSYWLEHFVFSISVINCGSPTIPIHLELVSVSSTYYLGQAKYRCNPGYKSLDSSTGICQSNGHWTLPVCYGKMTLKGCPCKNQADPMILVNFIPLNFCYNVIYIS